MKSLLLSLMLVAFCLLPALGQNQTKPKYESYWISGAPWIAMLQNDIAVSVAHSEVRDYGKWHKFDVVISNLSDKILEFDPSQGLFGSVVKERYRRSGLVQDNRPLEVWSAKDFKQKIQLTHGVATVLAATGMGVATGVSGETYTVGRGFSSSGGFYTFSATTYNTAASVMAQMQSQLAVSSMMHNMGTERESKMIGYLQRHTLFPGDSISGYVLMEYGKGDYLHLMMVLDGDIYPFMWKYDIYKEVFMPFCE